MANQYFLERDHKRFGPFSAAQLKELGAASRVQSTDLVWKEGMEKGVLATHVTGLLPAAPGKDRLANVNVTAAEVSSSQPANPGAGILVDNSLPSYEEETPVEPSQRIVPDELMLIKISGEIDYEPGTSPPPTAPRRGENSKGPSKTESYDVISAEDSAPPDKPKTSPNQSRPARKDQVRNLRAGSARGAIIVSQDGEFVSYKKKCYKCGLEDPTTARMPLRSGPNRSSFFCQKCQKMRDIEIQGSL